MGNNYARDEFKRHKSCKPDQATIFMAEWTNYAIDLSKQIVIKGKNPKKAKVGDNLSVDDLKLFKDDQIVQLYELSQAAAGGTAEEKTTNAENDTIPKKT